MRRRQSCRAPSAVCAWSTTPRPRGSHAGVDAAGTGQLQRHLRDVDGVEEDRGADLPQRGLLGTAPADAAPPPGGVHRLLRQAGKVPALQVPEEVAEVRRVPSAFSNLLWRLSSWPDNRMKPL